MSTLGENESISIVWTWGTEDHWVTSFFKCHHKRTRVFSQFFPNGDAGSRNQEVCGIWTCLSPFSRPSWLLIFPPRTFGWPLFLGAKISLMLWVWLRGLKRTLVAIYSALLLCLEAHKGVDNALIVSPLTHSMLERTNLQSDRKVKCWNLDWAANCINSKKFSIEFVLLSGTASTDMRDGNNESAGKISQTFMEWGNLLMKEATERKQGLHQIKNMWISRLGYSTTGVYHYNPCDCQNNSHGWGCPTSSGSSLLEIAKHMEITFA